MATEDIQMFARKLSPAGRATMLATVATLAMTAVAPSFAYAGSAAHGRSVVTAASGATDFSARRRLSPGAGAAAAAVAGIVGTGIAIAAAQNSQAYYGGGYYGYGGPVYVSPAPGPYYYGYDPAFGPNQYGADVPYVNGQPLAGW